MEVGVNTVLIGVGGERRTNILNFAHLFFGVGSFAGPFAATHAVGLGVSWRWPYVVTAFLTIGVGLAWLSVRDTSLPSEELPPDPAPAQRIDMRLVLLLATLLGVYVGVETGVGWWITKYLTTVRQVPIDAAGNVLALYWLGLTALRLVLTFTAHHARDEHLIVVMAVAATMALIVALSSNTTAMATVAFALTGMGLSGIFPAVIAIGGRTHPRDVAHVTSILIAGAGVGGIVIPWAMSAVADRTSMTTGMAFYAAISLLMVVLSITLIAMLARRSRT
jgi:fucose permease